MKSFEEHIRELCALEGISGREDAVRGYLIDELKASPADMEWETITADCPKVQPIFPGIRER